MYVKYCGCQTEEDYLLLSSSRADMIGFVFADSKRKVSPEEVSSWVRSHEKRKQIAGVFQDSPIEEMVAAAIRVPLDIIQCHGNESVNTIATLKKQTKKLIYKAIPYSEAISEQIERYGKYADAIIVDSLSKGQFGGTGTSFSWERVPEIMSFAKKENIPCFIAGGITPENIHNLLRCNPHGIDLSGGIESDGKKCKDRIEKLERMMLDVSSNRT
ncbi:phosphoribosylanthranilate isomerase [Fictibacillus phosphorivorans]|uniref:phosphoribosylanthranilate isomerase n=1 Tax=Fictibacillus phosphorivorans TaxID=1221500 RepID=UPI00203B1B87|nr:phosphoribosylanthranilate isomerase [Fictibacillus phosphorivorans]MCM3718928.1 phosphoribosylanthranilate isomerase [Fictibacillus phosphorivorans]MCM3776550.1 phosphoribosylanthranilate isomerase [Fictibacillus phosphorivorans]